MAVSVTLNGATYSIPSDRETGWGSNVRSWIQAVSTSTLQKSGGTFTLTASVNFGSTYGLTAGFLASATYLQVGEISTPSTPSSGFGRYYANASGLPTFLNDGGVEKVILPQTTAGDLVVYTGTTTARLAVGSDGQTIVADSSQTNKLKWATLPQGNKNYITYNNFENNATTGWHKATVTLSSLIPTGAPTVDTAASITTFASTATTPLAGTYSLQVAASSGFTAGQGIISDAYTVDREDLAKVLSFKFYYELNTAGTGYNFSGTSSNTFAVYIYDTANTAWIQPAGVYSMVQSVGVGYASGTFQTPANMTSFRILVVAINATTSNTDIEFDDFSVGPQATSYSIQKAPTQQRFTSSSGTYTTPGGVSYIRVRMVGGGGGGAANQGTAGSAGSSSTFGSSLLTCNGGSAGGTGTGGAGGSATISSPAIGTVMTGGGGCPSRQYTSGSGNGYEIGGNGGSSFFGGAGLGGGPTAAGGAGATNSGSGGGGGATDVINTAIYGGSGGGAGGYLEAFIVGPSASYAYAVGAGGAGGVGTQHNGGAGAAGYIEVTEYYAADVATNTDADTRVMAVIASKTSGNHSSSGSWQTVASWTTVKDTHTSFTASTGIVIAPSTGFYEVSGAIAFAANATGKRSVRAVNSTSGYSANGQFAINLSASSVSVPISQLIYATAGDSLVVQAYQDSGGALNYDTSDGSNICFRKLTGPAVVAASETVAFRGRLTAAGKAVTTTQSTIVFDTKDYDTHGTYSTSTGLYTIPVSGYYSVKGDLNSDNTTAVRGTTIRIYKNATSASPPSGGTLLMTQSFSKGTTTTSVPLTSVCGIEEYFNANDTVQISIAEFDNTFTSNFGTDNNYFIVSRIK